MPPANLVFLKLKENKITSFKEKVTNKKNLMVVFFLSFNNML